MNKPPILEEAHKVIEQALAVSGHGSFEELARNLLARSLERQGRVAAAKAMRSAPLSVRKGRQETFPYRAKSC